VTIVAIASRVMPCSHRPEAESLGLVLFNDIGITCGRLDESPVEDHSITVFAKGLWDDRLSRLQELKLR
jgi:hypothetical protein